jgi:hypothetical protein
MASLLFIMILSTQPAKPGLIYVVESDGIKLFGPPAGTLYTVDPATAKRTQLTPPFHTGLGDSCSISPDGRYVVHRYLHNENGETHYFLQIRELTPDIEKQTTRLIRSYGRAMAWTKDSQHFVIQEDITWDKTQYLVDANTLKMSTISLP